MTSKKRMIAISLTAILMLSLLLTACSNGGETPTEDNSTPPGTSSTPGATDTQTPTPDNTTEPDTTPDAQGTTTPDASETDTPEKKDFAWLDPSNYDMEKKSGIDELIEYYGGDEIDIDKLIKEAFEEYSEYINENITLESVRTAICAASPAQVYSQNNNLCRLPQETCNDVNDFLISKGKDPLKVEFDKNNVEQSSKHSIAALAIAVSINYKENLDNHDDDLYDLAKAFDNAYRYEGRLGTVGSWIMNYGYVILPE